MEVGKENILGDMYIVHPQNCSYFLSPPPLVTVTLTPLISTVVCFWGTPLPLPAQTSYVHAPPNHGSGDWAYQPTEWHAAVRRLIDLQFCIDLHSTGSIILEYFGFQRQRRTAFQTRTSSTMVHVAGKYRPRELAPYEKGRIGGTLTESPSSRSSPLLLDKHGILVAAQMNKLRQRCR